MRPRAEYRQAHVGADGLLQRQVAQGLDDYYSGRGEAAGEWMGSDAGVLGLAGEVDEAGFSALMEGRDPVAGGPLGRHAGRSTVAGFDLTFSAPKSVSVLFAIADRYTATAMVEAHREASRPRSHTWRARRASSGAAMGEASDSGEPAS